MENLGKKILFVVIILLVIIIGIITVVIFSISRKDEASNINNNQKVTRGYRARNRER